jgi:hypothetical protein
MIFKGRIAEFPRIIYQSKQDCDEVVEHLLRTDPKMYKGISSQPYVKQIN